MVVGADSIQDMNLLRHPAMATLLGGIRDPSASGSFLHALDWGNVRRLGSVLRLFLAAPAAETAAGGGVCRDHDQAARGRRS